MKLAIIIQIFISISLVLAEKRIRVMCMGDSTTQGYGASDMKKYSYPLQLQGMLDQDKYEVMNFGKPAVTVMSSGEVPYKDHDSYKLALKSNPDILIFWLGINDTKHQNWEKGDRNETAFKANYTEIILPF